MDLVPWSPLADSEGFIFVSMDGMNDVAGGGDYGSWNVSATSGPLGLTCDPGLVGEYPCYESCDTSGDCSYLQVSHVSESCHAVMMMNVRTRVTGPRVGMTSPTQRLSCMM